MNRYQRAITGWAIVVYAVVLGGGFWVALHIPPSAMWYFAGVLVVACIGLCWSAT